MTASSVEHTQKLNPGQDTHAAAQTNPMNAGEARVPGRPNGALTNLQVTKKKGAYKPTERLQTYGHRPRRTEHNTDNNGDAPEDVITVMRRRAFLADLHKEKGWSWKEMTYPCKRRFDIHSMGQWMYKVPGRPDTSVSRQWREMSNFVLTVVAKVVSCPGYTTENGWLIDILGASNETVSDYFISIDVASSNLNLRKHLMKAFAGCICQLASIDFLDFVASDNPTRTVYSVNGIGKIRVDSDSAWLFPNLTFSSSPDFDVIFTDVALKHRSVPTLPTPHMRPQKDFYTILTDLSAAMRKVYPHSYMHVVHLLTSVLKAVHFDSILAQEHFVPVTNISGPANVGKTLACAVALNMMESPTLMLSRCTSSSMLDAADTFHNLLIVWDDPRDTTASQMSSIVHEAFNGISSSTVCKGLRRYNSNLIIGTQNPLLGMPVNDVNAATFSRLSHIVMDLPHDTLFNSTAEPELQAGLTRLKGCLHHLTHTTAYDKEMVDQIASNLDGEAIVGRAHRIAAIDHFLMAELDKIGIRNKKDERRKYFQNYYMPFLKRWVSSISPFDQFLKCLHHIETIHFPTHSYKKTVLVDLKEYGPCECASFYTKTFFEFLHKTIPESKTFSKEWVHSYVKHNKHVGEVSRNVAYRVSPTATQIKRSIVIRRSLIK